MAIEERKCYCCINKQMLYYTYYFLKAYFQNLKKNIKQCICPKENNIEENNMEESNYRLEEVIIVNNDNSIENMDINKKNRFKYINTSSSEEIIYEREDTTPIRKGIKRRNIQKIRDRIGKNIHPKRKKAKYNAFENNLDGIIKYSKNEVSKSEVSENKVSENKVSENKVSENETSESEASKSEASKSEVSKSEASKSKASENKVSENETSESEASENDTRPKKLIKKKINNIFSTSDEEDWDILQ